MNRRLLVVAVAAIFLGYFVAQTRWHLFSLNWSPSIDMGLYVRIPAGEQRSRIAVFCPPDKIYAYVNRWEAEPHNDNWCAEGNPFIKEIVAVAGDTVTLSAQGVSVNGGPILPGSAPLKRYAGAHTPVHELPAIPFGTYHIGAGEIWSYGPRWYSLDSRYFGPVRPLALERPLMTLPLDNETVIPKRIADLQR